MATSTAAQATSYKWQLLGNSPSASSRTDDIWFFNENVGWLVNSSGYVAKTEDGGQFWHQKFFVYPGLPSRPYLRSMSWANENVGWFGSVTGLPVAPKPDPSAYLDTLLFHTTDAGESWAPVLNLPQDSPAGICGFHAVSEKVAYGSGTNDPGLAGPGIIKTTDGGASWELIPMEQHADNLIDIFFFDKNNGFVVGGKNRTECPASTPASPVTGYEPPRFSRYAQLKPVVLRTTDGGKNWTDTALGTDFPVCGEWGWKIQFVNEKIGFVALENFIDAAILTTTDGGASWTRKRVAANQDPGSPAINNDLEGIGFIDELKGWVGGWGNNFKGFQNSYTEDGGNTWVRQDYKCNDPGAGDPRYRINRYRFIRNGSGDVKTGYCCGQQVFKLKKGVFGKKTAFGAVAAFATGTDRNEPAHSGQLCHAAIDEADGATSMEVANSFDITHATAKDGSVEISYTLPAESQNVFVGLWNKFAFHVRTLVAEQIQTAGRQTIVWDGKDDEGNPAGDGVFICRICTDRENGDSQMIQMQGAF